MYEGIIKFGQLLNTDTDLQQKLQTALENYSGETNEEAVFNEVLAPIAAEYDIYASYDEFKSYFTDMKDRELEMDELEQIAGGKKGGAGANICWAVGVGLGGVFGGDDAQLCIALGAGYGDGACMGSGV